MNSSPTVVTRTASVNRTKDPWQIVSASQCQPRYLLESVVASMPRGGEGLHLDVEVEFFCLGREVTPDVLEQEYAARNLVPDPYALAHVNIVDPLFSDRFPNLTLWKDAKGRWCCLSFKTLGGARYISVGYVNGFDLFWHFGGVRKQQA